MLVVLVFFFLNRLKTAANINIATPRNWGVILYNSLDVLDVVGSIEPLYLLSNSTQLNLSLIAETMQPVTMRPVSPVDNPMHSHFELSVNPTHTFANPPANLDVLFVPGGGGKSMGNITAAANFVRTTYPKVKYLISVCTGAAIAAEAGVLDGKRATTNKAAWNAIIPLGKNVQWTSPARWVVDGNTWSSSGVVAGIDLIFAFIEDVYGKNHAHEIQGLTEHNRIFDPCDDPFAGWHNVSSRGYCT